MRIFKDCRSMINEVTREVFTRGKVAFDSTVQGRVVDRKDYEVKELIGYSFTIKSTADKGLMLDWVRKTFNKPGITNAWCEAWSQDRLAGVWKNQPSYKLREEYWRPFIEDDGLFAYNYEERMFYLPRIIYALKRNKSMRSAVLNIFNISQDATNLGKRRVPCSLYFHFLVRSEAGVEKLIIIYGMRASDLVNHLAPDIYMCARLQEYVAGAIGVEVGDLIFNSSSLHAFKKDCPRERTW